MLSNFSKTLITSGVLATAFLFPNNAFGATLTDSVSCPMPDEPVTSDEDQTISNGNCKITEPTVDSVDSGNPLGDGVNERTRWSFFSESNIEISKGAKVADVSLELTWNPMEEDIVSTDSLKFAGGSTENGANFSTTGKRIFSLSYEELTEQPTEAAMGDFQTTTIDVLDVIKDINGDDNADAKDFKTVFNNNNGTLSAQYADDATIKSSEIKVNVPEPTTTVGLVAVGLLATTSIKRRRQ